MADEGKEAQKCFEENIRVMDPSKEPEKYNLYKGLLNLALLIQRMEIDIKGLQREISYLASSLR